MPSSFVTDFASVPRFLQSIVQATGAWTMAAVLHDWLVAGLRRGECPIPPRDADGVFRRVLREEGVGLVRRWLMWAAVRWGALFSRARRGPWRDWLRDGPVVVAITAAFLAAVVGVVYVADRALHALI